MDFLVGGLVVLILASSLSYVCKQLRNGNHCVGCSHGDGCGSCPCSTEEE